MFGYQWDRVTFQLIVILVLDVCFGCFENRGGEMRGWKRGKGRLLYQRVQARRKNGE
jgi:hypothetical protein